MHRLLLLLPALATTIAEPDWAQRAAAVKDAIHASFGAYMAHASDFDVLLPAAKTGGDVAGARYALYESLDTLYVAGLADDFDAAVAAIFAGGLRDPLRRGAPAPKRVASVAEYARRVVGGLLGGFEVSGDRRLLYAAAHAAERALDALPDTQDVVVLPPDRSRLVHARTASVRYLLSHWVDDGADCETVGNAGGFGLELRALSRELDDPSFASAADAIFDEIDTAWFQDGAKDSARRLPRYPACDSRARSDLKDAATLFGSLLGEQLIGSTHGAARAAALYDWWEQGLLEEGADVLHSAGDLTFPVTPGGTPAVEAATFGLPGLLALGATHAFRKGNADEDDKRDALALAARVAEAVHAAHAAAGGLAPDAATLVEGDGVRFAAVRPSYDLDETYAYSLLVLYRTTGDEKYRDRGWALFEQIAQRCAVGGAFAGLVDVFGDARRKRMPSHFVGATLKHLYLLFSEKDHYSLDDWVFTNGGHLVAATHRCDGRDCSGPEDRPWKYAVPVDLLFFGSLLVLAQVCLPRSTWTGTPKKDR
ncbi:mannosyl-oligosaccharide 1,2-alpha-mannosidase [Aureococcus anophagefferens]|uniref:alpha-1,2-Mannosidase n=2 Tax=Aureococcus anophagefferens TaxID=44056 RepID=A0ABR1FZM4_AURAN